MDLLIVVILCLICFIAGVIISELSTSHSKYKNKTKFSKRIEK